MDVRFLEEFISDGTITCVEPIAQAGSDRQYSRICTGQKSYIHTTNKNLKENEAFFYFSRFFREHNIPVPDVLAIHANRAEYIQSDLGNDSLLDIVLQQGHTDTVKELYKKSLQALVRMQLAGIELDDSYCLASQTFDKQAILADLNYFKYYFADIHNITYNKSTLQAEFEQLAQSLIQEESKYFMYRDFQGRNIMIKQNKPYFIDYQGGMKGPLQYDVASLLWQAKAALPHQWRTDLYHYYKKELTQYISIQEQSFDKTYERLVLIRLLQVLGAYGLRGIIEQRMHFLTSIPKGIENVSEWCEQYNTSDYPELNRVLQQLKEIDIKKYKKPRASNDTPLRVLVQSFSYKKGGIPKDETDNGGGFVFDCRGILNPGRFEPYKKLTGRDKEVKQFLEEKTEVATFLKHAKAIVGISVEDYLNRGFKNLMISFGCTGGQHRSVYCADAMAKYLKEMYNIDATVKHIEQEAKNWIN